METTNKPDEPDSAADFAAWTAQMREQGETHKAEIAELLMASSVAFGQSLGFAAQLCKNASGSPSVRVKAIHYLELAALHLLQGAAENGAANDWTFEEIRGTVHGLADTLNSFAKAAGFGPRLVEAEMVKVERRDRRGKNEK